MSTLSVFYDPSDIIRAQIGAHAARLVPKASQLWTVRSAFFDIKLGHV